MRDQRDPQKLGELWLILRRKNPGSDVASLMRELGHMECPDYDTTHMGPVEKYGDPRVLPSTLPN